MNTQIKHCIQALLLAVVSGVAVLGCSSDGDEGNGLGHGSVTSAAGSEQQTAGSSDTGTAGVDTGFAGSVERGGATGQGGSTVEEIGGATGAGGKTGNGGATSQGGSTVEEIGGATGQGGSEIAEGGSDAIGGEDVSAGTTGEGGSEDPGAGGSTVEEIGGATGQGGIEIAEGGSDAIGGEDVSAGTTGEGGSEDPGVGGATAVCANEQESCVDIPCCNTNSLICDVRNGFCVSLAENGGTTSSGGAVGNGGVTGSGGNIGNGGATGQGGSGVGGSTVEEIGGATGAGGASVCVPAERPVTTTVGSPYTGCSTPVRDMLFHEQRLIFANKSVVISEDDVWVLGMDYDHSALTHWNGLEWSTPLDLFPELYSSKFNTLTLDGSGNLWTAGNAQCAGCVAVGRVIRLDLGTGDPEEVSSGLPEGGIIEDFFIANDKKFALVTTSSMATGTIEITSSVYELASSQWESLVSYRNVHGWVLWGTSEKDLFLAGFKSAGNEQAGAFLSRFNGCDWNEIAMPDDLNALGGFHGYEGTVVAIGNIGGDDPRPVRLISTDLVNWTRSDGDGATVFEGDVFMADPSSLIASGGDSMDGHDGGARLTIGTHWQTMSIDDEVEDVSGISRMGSSDTFLLTGCTLDSEESRVYRMTCTRE